MRGSLLSVSIFTVLLLSAAAFGQANYSTYSNARFGYSIQYPKSVFLPQPEAENGDGRVFLTKDKSAELRVWGQYNALARTLSDSYKEDLGTYSTGVSYKVLKGSSYVISGTTGGKIFYQKTMLNGSGNDTGAIYCTFTITYRKADKAKYDPIVTKIANTFRFN